MTSIMVDWTLVISCKLGNYWTVLSKNWKLTSAWIIACVASSITVRSGYVVCPRSEGIRKFIVIGLSSSAPSRNVFTLGIAVAKLVRIPARKKESGEVQLKSGSREKL